MIHPNWVWGLVEIALLTFLAMIGVHIFIVLGIIGTVFAILYYGDTRSIVIIGSSFCPRLRVCHFDGATFSFNGNLGSASRSGKRCLRCLRKMVF